jgi:hypothetical protein
MARRNKERTSLSGVWAARRSQLILFLAGIVAWGIAVGLALLDKSDAIGVAFVTVGFPLIGAAALYGRLREFGPSGVKTDPLQEAVRELDERLPPPGEDVSAIEERSRLLEAFEVLVSDPPYMADEPLPGQEGHFLPRVDLGVSVYERSIRLEAAAADWLKREGFVVQSDTRDAGVDIIASRPGEIVYALQVMSSRGVAGGPTPEALRDHFLKARIWVDARLGEGEPFCRLLVTDIVPPPNLLDRFRRHGIGILRIDLDSGQVGMALQPKDSRT